jgi:hypothetical protein
MTTDSLIQDEGSDTQHSALSPASGLHPMSREGRRQAIVLLLGVLSIAVFALWSFINILQDGVDGVEWVSGLLMLAILLVTPLVGWTLLEEAQASVQANDKGVTYKTAGGVTLAFPWTEVTGFEQKTGRSRLARFFLGDDKDDAPVQPSPGEQDENVADGEPGTLLLTVRTDPSQQITNPLVRFLHRQAYSTNIPIHGGLEARQQLIEEIKTRTGT